MGIIKVGQLALVTCLLKQRIVSINDETKPYTEITETKLQNSTK